MIRQLEENDFDKFFTYLDQHLAENGNGETPLFHPAPRNASGYPAEKQAGFVQGLVLPIGNPKWRRAWFAADIDGQIVGHIDLRARPDPCTEHRALLGMGVRKDKQRLGIGRNLLEFGFDWARQTGLIEIIDLNVMADNLPAIQLYQKAGFIRLCQIEDMFRIDGRSEADIMMTKRLCESFQIL
jgi:ribosomal protein S18 acetylase RimI-like enzyme